MRWAAAVGTAALMLGICGTAGAQTPTLGGSNEISGDRSGFLDVQLAEPTRVSFD